MEKATPVQMRESLEIVELFKKAGIRFIPMPVLNETDLKNLSYHLNKRLETMALEAEKCATE